MRILDNNEMINADMKNTFTHWYLYSTNLYQKLDGHYNNQLKINKNRTIHLTDIYFVFLICKRIFGMI